MAREYHVGSRVSFQTMCALWKIYNRTGMLPGTLSRMITETLATIPPRKFIRFWREFDALVKKYQVK